MNPFSLIFPSLQKICVHSSPLFSSFRSHMEHNHLPYIPSVPLPCPIFFFFTNLTGVWLSPVNAGYNFGKVCLLYQSLGGAVQGFCGAGRNPQMYMSVDVYYVCYNVLMYFLLCNNCFSSIVYYILNAFQLFSSTQREYSHLQNVLPGRTPRSPLPLQIRWYMVGMPVLFWNRVFRSLAHDKWNRASIGSRRQARLVGRFYAHALRKVVASEGILGTGQWDNGDCSEERWRGCSVDCRWECPCKK